MSATERLVAIGGGLWRDVSGIAAVSFALIAPLLIALMVGIIEFSLIAFDYGRATEATRRAVRIATIERPVGSLTNLATTAIKCTGAGGSVSCTGGSVTTAATFDNVVASMRDILPTIQSANLEIVYENSGIGLPAAGGLKPLVTVRLVGLQRPFMTLGLVPGMPSSFTYPPFTTSHLGPGLTAWP